jgi:anti-sigma regulatory factor (Ser/Thr protein kinase)
LRRRSLDTPEPLLASEHVTITATADRLGAMHEALDRFWRQLDDATQTAPDDMWRLQFLTAIMEIAGNIVRHAYPDGTDPGPLEMTLTALPNRVEAELRDRGVPYEETPRGEPAPNADLLDLEDLAESGRGLMIARAWLDRLEHTHTPDSNCWLLVKRY